MLQRKNNEITSREIVSRITFAKDCPLIFLAVGPSRSGTTAQLRIFAQAGMQAWYQPLKSILRGIGNGQETKFVIPDEPRLFIKEALGPYTREEASMNPLALLLEAGVPPEKICLISIMREPLSCVSSLIEYFSIDAPKQTLIENAVVAYKTVGDITQQAKTLEIPTTVFVYESLRDNEAVVSIRSLFERLNLPFTANIVTHWDRSPSFGSPESRIFSLELSHLLHEDHHKLRRARELVYFKKSIQTIDENLTEEDVLYLHNSGIFGIYERFLQECEKDLKLKIHPPQELPDYLQRHHLKKLD